jgi:hypothetical protein
MQSHGKGTVMPWKQGPLGNRMHGKQAGELKAAGGSYFKESKIP